MGTKCFCALLLMLQVVLIHQLQLPIAQHCFACYAQRLQQFWNMQMNASTSNNISVSIYDYQLQKWSTSWKRTSFSEQSIIYCKMASFYKAFCWWHDEIWRNQFSILWQVTVRTNENNLTISKCQVNTFYLQWQITQQGENMWQICMTNIVVL